MGHPTTPLRIATISSANQAGLIAQDAVTRPQPEDKTHEQHAQAFGKGIATVGQRRKEAQGQRQRGQRNQLDDEIPAQKNGDNLLHKLSEERRDW
jgi:hypothetical protein